MTNNHISIGGIKVNVIFGGREAKSDKNPLIASRQIKTIHNSIKAIAPMRICCCLLCENLLFFKALYNPAIIRIVQIALREMYEIVINSMAHNVLNKVNHGNGRMKTLRWNQINLAAYFETNSLIYPT